MARGEARHALTRRGFLGAVSGATVAGLGWSGASGVLVPAAQAGPTASDGDFDALRATWRELLTGGDADASDPDVAAAIAELDATTQQYVGLVERSTDRKQVFTDISLEGNGRPASGRMRDTYLRLAHMATAFRTSGSTYEHDDNLLADILAGLETTNVEVYNADQRQFGSWFHFQISGPHALGNTCVLVHEHIPADALDRYVAAIDHFVSRPRGTGANRVDLCQTVLVRGVIGNNTDKVQAARDGLSPVFTYVSDGDGFYRDGSVIQHQTVAYTGSYGVELLGGFANLGIAKQMALLAGTPWEITGTDREFVFDVVDRAYAPVMYSNQMMEHLRGRSISRDFQSGHDRGRLVTESVARLARAADSQTAARWRGMCKGWLERSTYQGPFAGATIAQTSLFRQLLDDPSVPASPEPVGHTLFGNMDRAVHRRPGWAYTISMSSKRISYYESINNENIKGFHTGDGMTYLYDADNGQYSDNFWPTVNMYRLPGITVDSKPLPDAAGDSGRPRPDDAAWVGGAVINGEFAAVGMDAEPLLTSLRAKKSWFCLDDAVVALGAGITGGGAQHPVETVVENRNLGADGVNALTIDGQVQPVEQGWTFSGNVGWAHLEGVGGYLFPGRATVNALREERTGAWSDIGKLRNPPDDPIIRRYATLWFDHGIQPRGESYAYILLPGASPAQTADRAENSTVSIVANTAERQAIRVNELDLFAVNFWAAGSMAGVRVSAPCSLLISGWRRRSAGSMTIALADPTHELDSVDVQIVAPGFSSYEADDTITVSSVSPTIRLTVDPAGAHGGTHTATFQSR